MSYKKTLAATLSAMLLLCSAGAVGCNETPAPSEPPSALPSPSTSEVLPSTSEVPPSTETLLTLDETWEIAYEGNSDAALLGARQLQAALLSTGLDLSVRADADTPYYEAGKELLVGVTDRYEMDEVYFSLSDEDYAVVYSGEKIALAGTNGVTVNAAVEHFIATFIEGKESVSLPEDYTYYGRKEVMTITQNLQKLQKELTYTATYEHIFSFRAEDINYTIVQGACFTGSNYYISMIKKDMEGYEMTRIVVLDAEGNYLRESEPLALDHANSITYIEKTGMLLVAHCQSPDGHFNRYSLVDPESLQITHTADLAHPFFAMAYSPELDKFASGEWGGNRLDVWDGDLNHLLGVDVEEPQTLSQSMFCDEKYIYFIRAGQNNHLAEFRVYDWDCNLAFTVNAMTPVGEEEATFIYDGKTYVICNDWTNGCGAVYEVTFTAQ